MQIQAAVAAIRRGEIVGVPTDTVYGLAVDPLQAAVRTLVERGVFELLAGMQTPEAYSGCLERAEIDS